MKKLLSMITLAAVLLSSALLSSCFGDKQFSKTDLTVFDTQAIVLGHEKSESVFNEKADNILNTLKEYHKLYDIYYEYEGINNLRTVNKNAGIAPVKVDSRIIDLLLFSKEMYEITNGMTNVAMGSILSIWHRYREEGIKNPDKAALPTEDELKAASLHADIEKIVINKKESTVFLEDPEMSLDVGAVAKGYAVEMVAQQFESDGCTGYALSVGGNVRCMGEKPGGEKWEIGIQNPDLSSAKAYVTTVYMTADSLVTSGSYQRYYTVAKKQYHHIIDPKTLMPQDDYAAVSVICAHSGIADGLSTALFNMTKSEGLAIAKKLNAEVIWVYPDGKTETTDGFSAYQIKN